MRLHDLRHTCVSMLLALGEHPRVVMEIAGHSAIEMTMNIYGHVALDSQRTACGSWTTSSVTPPTRLAAPLSRGTQRGPEG